MFYEGCIGKAERNLLLNWLKYLKERVQPKQEWGKEDERILEQIKFAVLNLPSYREDTRQECIDWIKLLKERIVR